MTKKKKGLTKLEKKHHDECLEYGKKTLDNVSKSIDRFIKILKEMEK